MEKLIVLTIGPHTFLSAGTVAAWLNAGVQLIGPIGSLDDISYSDVGQAAGAIIDVSLNVDALIMFTDHLDGMGIPAVFAASLDDPVQNRGFHLSREPAAIQAIMAALLDLDKVSRH